MNFALKSGSKKAVDRDRKKGPLYGQLAHTLKEEILAGIHPVGACLPTEDQLCARFSVSRHTVREALRCLRDEGLVTSRQGAGTLVAPPRAAGSDSHQVMSINDLVAFASETRFDIVSIQTVAVDAKLSDRTGLPKGSEWMEVCGYRYSDDAGEPVCKTEYYINRAFAAVGRLLRNYSGPIFPLIEDLFGKSIIEVHQQISAALISPSLSEELLVEVGSAALEVRRIYKTSSEEIAQVTINTHPASRFQHAMIMRRMKA